MKSLAGGIDAWEGAVATGGPEAGLEVLAEVRVAVVVLSVALALEEGSRVFYAAVGEVVDDGEWKELFGALVKAEEAHKASLAEACRTMIPEEGCEIPLDRGGLESRMEGAVGIEESLDWVRAEGRTPREILELSMQVEANSLDLYLRIARRPEFTPVREVLQVLIDDEKAHLRKMGALLERELR